MGFSGGRAVVRMMLCLAGCLVLCLAAPARAQTQFAMVPQLGHGGYQEAGVMAIAFAGDGELFATLGKDHQIKLWETETGLLVRTIPGWFVSPPVFSSDGHSLTVVAEVDDSACHLTTFDLESGERTANLPLPGVDGWSLLPFGSPSTHVDLAAQILYWADDTSILATPAQGRGQGWETAVVDSRALFHLHVTDGSVFASAGKTLFCLDQASGELLYEVAFDQEVVALDSVVAGELAVFSSSGAVDVLNVVNGQVLSSVQARAPEGAGDLFHAVMLDGRSCVLTFQGANAFETGGLLVLDLATGDTFTFAVDRPEGLLPLEDQDGTPQAVFSEFYSLAVSPDRSQLLTGGFDNVPCLWDLDNLALLYVTGSDAGGYDSSFQLNRDGTKALRIKFNQLSLYDLVRAERIHSVSGGELIQDLILDVWWSDDGSCVAMTGEFEQAGLFVYDFTEQALVWQGPMEIYAELDVAFSRNADHIAYVDKDTGLLSVYNIRSNELLLSLVVDASKESRAALTPEFVDPDTLAFSVAGRAHTFSLSTSELVEWETSLPEFLAGLETGEPPSQGLLTVNEPARPERGRLDGDPDYWSIDHIHARGTGELLCSLFEMDGEWMLLTPEGYYACSENGHELLALRLGLDIYAMDQFYDVFFRPDIVRAKLRGEDISSLVSLTIEEALAAPPPEVTLYELPGSVDSSSILVPFRVSSAGGGIGEIRVFVNGKLVRSDGFYRPLEHEQYEQLAALSDMNGRALLEQNRAFSVASVERAEPVALDWSSAHEETLDIELAPGENTISVCAFNRDNTVQSMLVSRTVTCTAQGAEPRLYILSVGVDDYAGEDNDLAYAAKDARDMRASLEEAATGLFTPENIHHFGLLDSEATRENILAALAGIAGQAGPGDAFVLFLAGHGILAGDQYSFVTSDFAGSLDESCLLTSAELVEASTKIAAMSQLLILDTCHAGGVDYLVSGLYDARISTLARQLGLHVYASCSSSEQALDGYEDNGLFTHALLSGLVSVEADKDADGLLGAMELGVFAHDRTVAISGELGFEQEPVIVNFGEDVGLARVGE
ncbi:MAG: hypothetical protein D6E12_03725 [Desulfovibrio sp.]|nr:MAG: hypothetical protein D6E12_03725 [Desulfovibrio sp.]